MSANDNPLPELPPEFHPEVRPQPQPPENPPWTGWDVVRIAVMTVIAIGIFNAVTFVLLRSLYRGHLPEFTANPKILVPIQFASYMVVLAFMYSVVAMYRARFWKALQWRWDAAGPGYFLSGIALALLVQLSSALLPIPKQLPIERFFRDATDAWVMAAFGVTVAPLVEELFFRGFLYPVLARRLGVGAGTVITAASFAFIHQAQLAHAWGPLLLLFLVGLVLTITRAQTKSVAAPFLIHVAYNLTLFALLYVATDHFRHLEKIS